MDSNQNSGPDELDSKTSDNDKKRRNKCLLIFLVILIVMMLPSTLAFLAIF